MVRSRHAGPELDLEAAIAGSHLAFQPRQCVFLVGVGMQEDGEVAPDFAVFQSQKFFPSSSDHHPVALLDRQAQQRVSNGSSNQIHLHA